MREVAWITLFFAGLLETGWALGLKYTEGFTKVAPSVATLAVMAGSIYLLSLLDAGGIDHAFEYRDVAEEHGLR